MHRIINNQLGPFVGLGLPGLGIHDRVFPWHCDTSAALLTLASTHLLGPTSRVSPLDLPSTAVAANIMKWVAMQ